MSKATVRLTAFFLLCVLLSAAAGHPFSAYAAGDQRMIAVISGGKLHMRASASSSGDVLATFDEGTQVNVLEKKDKWCHVEKNGKTGYMMTKYLQFLETYTHLGYGYTDAGHTVINLYRSPDQNSEIVCKFFGGARFEIVEKQASWYRVRSGNNFGYLPAEALHETTDEYAYVTCLDDVSAYTVNASAINARRDLGTQKGMSMSKGGFSYTVSYPLMGLGAADATVTSAVRGLIDCTEADFKQHHSGASAVLTLDYSVDRLDENYATVTLFGSYAVSGQNSVTVYEGLTVNYNTGDILDPTQLFTNRDWILFQLESKLTRAVGDASGSYTLSGDTAFLSRALLTREGVSLLLPAGMLLPLSCGAQKVTLTYMQTGDLITLDTPIVSDNKRRIDPTKPMIALTFDDGPSAETLRILDALETYGGRATFCVVGTRLNTYANVLKATVASGQEVACHTWGHKKLTELSEKNVRSQITRVTDLVRELTGYEIKVLRPPYGSNNKRVRNVCADLGLVIAHWEVDTQDWVTRSASKTYDSIMNNAENGAIVLCHDIYETTADAAVSAIPELVQQGYQLVTVSELLSFHKDGATPGTVYSHLAPENIDTSKGQ